MSKRAVESRIARDIVERYGRVDDSPGERHGSREVARNCRCEICRRAFPDKKKRQKNRERARKTNACMQGTSGHARCAGWKFAAGVDGYDSVRGASPCQCACHTDGRGREVPPLEDYMAERETDRQQHEAWLIENGMEVKS